MATWTTIPDSSLEPGKPTRGIDGLALRDNAIAIAEGQPGAPKIVDAALGTSATNTGRDWVLARTALAEAGAVGTYAFLRPNNTTSYSQNTTLAGSNLRYSAAVTKDTVFGENQTMSLTVTDGGTPSGTWRCMGNRQATNNADYNSVGNVSTLWLRIS
jgi:hypothetical protein